MSKFKVGVIVDHGLQSKQTHEFLQLAAASDLYEVALIIEQKTFRSSNQTFFQKLREHVTRRGVMPVLETALFRTICWAESQVVRRDNRFRDFFAKFSLGEFGIATIEVEPDVSKSGHVYRYKDKDLDAIRSHDIDLLVRSGSGILRGAILDACKFGVISFHHADNAVNRGGPPGFWEVYNRERSTGFILQILKDELDGGDVILKGGISTSFMYSLNLARLYTKSNIFLHKTIEKIAEKRRPLAVLPKRPYAHPLYRMPGIFKQVIYLCRTAIHAAVMVSRKIFKRDMRWGVAYQFASSWRDVTLWKSARIQNPPNRFLADPFVVKRDGKHYCFVEDYFYENRKGIISVVEIDAAGHRLLGTAIEEDFHLSYPFLLEVEGTLYLCPETHESNDIRLYRCVDFPLVWTLEKILMSDVNATDTNIFHKDGRWWLMTNIDSSPLGDHGSELHLFHADSFLSDDWQPHEKNPVIFDSRRARNGGLLSEGDDLYRVFQIQGWSMYGEAFGVAKILNITPSEYQEEVEFHVGADFIENAKGTHTYGYNDGLVVLDYVCAESIRK